MPVNIPIQSKDPGLDPKVIKTIIDALILSDFNKDGGYSREELKHAIKNLGSMFPAWRTYRCFGKADTNHDGLICGNEIDTLVEELISQGFGKK